METGIYIRCKGHDGKFGSFDIGTDAPVEEVVTWLRTKNPSYVEAVVMAILGRRPEYEARVVQEGL